MSCPVDADTRSAWLALQAQARRQEKETGSTRSDPASSSSSAAPPTPSRPNNDSARAHAFLAVRGLAGLADRPASSRPRGSSTGAPHTDAAAREGLSLEREISSIPRSRTTPQYGSAGSHGSMAQAATEEKDDKWVYPSPAQFYAALARKHSDNPADVADMSVVVPLHNAVNERTWAQIRGWEAQFHPDCLFSDSSGLKLITFEGKANEPTWRAWSKSLMGYTPPFDRHDWTVDRCGQQVRYVIDYYSGKPAAAPADAPREGQGVSFYLDVRPAPDSARNLYMRFWRAVRGTPPDKLTA